MSLLPCKCLLQVLNKNKTKQNLAKRRYLQSWACLASIWMSNTVLPAYSHLWLDVKVNLIFIYKAFLSETR